MTSSHRQLLFLSYAVIATEFALAVYFHEAVIEWVTHNLWVVFVPFLKVVFKRIIALKLVAFLKAALVLAWHLSKLLLLKILKTLGIRYGVFFSQYRWYWIRWTKVMFLRRGRQFFRGLTRFWRAYTLREQWVVVIAFFPIFLVLFFLGLSFNVTRKTMVQKAQESALFEMAATATTQNSGLRGWIARIDKLTLQRIRDLTPRARGSDD
ncbi:MAG: hypothetical protein AAF431_06715 [Pseudomonadota bacterium]